VILLVLIMNWEPGFDDMDSIYASPDDFRQMRERNKAKGLHLLEFFVKKCHDIGVGCEAWIRKGDPTELICHEVRRVRPDFLVVGSRGLGPFQKYVQSSHTPQEDLFLLYSYTISISHYVVSNDLLVSGKIQIKSLLEILRPFSCI